VNRAGWPDFFAKGPPALRASVGSTEASLGEETLIGPGLFGASVFLGRSPSQGTSSRDAALTDPWQGSKLAVADERHAGGSQLFCSNDVAGGLARP